MSADGVRNDGDAVARPLEVVESLAAALLASPSVRDNRIGRDLRQFIALALGPWQDRVALTRASAHRRTGDLMLALSLVTPGHLRVKGGEVRLNNRWQLDLALPSFYPKVAPVVRFRSPTPFNMHVVDPDDSPELAGLPSELQTYLRLGRGSCCYSDGWSSHPSYTLSLALYQVSRLLALETFRGEAGSLNPAARDHVLGLGGAGVPLGRAFPPPDVDGGDAETLLEPDIEWEEEG